jgi:hypothetical protein
MMAKTFEEAIAWSIEHRDIGVQAIIAPEYLLWYLSVRSQEYDR